MEIAPKRLKILPLSYQSQASHLLLQSGLTSAQKTLDRAEVEEVICKAAEPISFCCDIFHVIPENDLFWSEDRDLSCVSLLLDFYEVQKHKRTLISLLKNGLSLYFVVHRDLTDKELTLFKELDQHSKNIFILYIESKLFSFNHFWQNTSADLRGKVVFSYLPKLNNWDALLSPLESLESLNLKKSQKISAPLLVIFNESMEDLEYSEKAFYLNPSKEEYTRLFSKSWSNTMARMKIFNLLKSSGLVFILAKILRWILSPRESYRKANIVWNFKALFLAGQVYWAGFHFLSESKVIAVKLCWWIRNLSVSLLWFLRSLTTKTFWSFYGFRGSIRVFSIRLAWLFRNFFVALFWTGNRLIGFGKIFAIWLFWKIKPIPGRVRWKTVEVSTFVFWKVYKYLIVAFWKARAFSTTFVWQTRIVLSFVFWRTKHYLRAGFFLFRNSFIFYPFYKTYCFFEYQFEKRLLSRLKSES